MRCKKCNGLVAVYHDEARCLNCGRYYFPPDSTIEICSQGGNCGRDAEIDGLCWLHHKQRMAMVNNGRNVYKRYRA